MVSRRSFIKDAWRYKWKEKDCNLKGRWNKQFYYEGIEVGTRRADFIIEGKIVVELKALVNLEDVHLAQAKNYVVAYNLPVGLLINFGAVSLQFKKVYNKKFQ